MNYSPLFTSFYQIDDVIIEPTQYDKSSIQFGLDYQMTEEKNKFIMKFIILSPKNDFEALKIKHGYIFQVSDSLIVNSTSMDLSIFFAHLITRSLILVNETIQGTHQVFIPDNETLSKTIFPLLSARSN